MVVTCCRYRLMHQNILYLLTRLYNVQLYMYLKAIQYLKLLY